MDKQKKLIWLLLPILLVLLIAYLIATFNVTEEFTSTATITVIRDDPPVHSASGDIMTEEDFTKQVSILQQGALIQAVAEQIPEEDRKIFEKPYKTTVEQPKPETED